MKHTYAEMWLAMLLCLPIGGSPCCYACPLVAKLSLVLAAHAVKSSCNKLSWEEALLLYQDRHLEGECAVQK